MPNTREKLIELIEQSYYCDIVSLAEDLVSKGVTVQEWISVKDGLPLSNTYVNVTTDGVVAQAYWHNDRFYAFTAIGVATVGGVTHWMPLPQPPKGE